MRPNYPTSPILIRTLRMAGALVLTTSLAGATAFWELPDAEVWCRCLQWGRLRRLQDEGRRTSTHVHAADALIRIERIGSSEYNCLLDARKPRFEAMDAGIAHYPSTDQTH